MDSLWSDSEARASVERYAQQGVGEDLALRVYTTRLLGGDPKLVLHGGGNTSVKTSLADVAGDEVETLCVKGSGWDMGDIEPAGLPAVRLEPLRRLRALDTLSDEDMVNAQRGNLLDSAAPTPSVETLLHAFLPHKFVDHTHATAILALTDQPDGADICRDVFGDRVALVPYIMPGFALAKSCAEIYERSPQVEGLILLKHGVFAFGTTAREPYERMVDLVTLAEQYLADASPKPLVAVNLPQQLATPAAIAPALRGQLAIETDGVEGLHKRFVLEFRTGAAIRNFVDGADLARYSQQGPVTPDHAIRIKPLPAVLPPPAADDLGGFFDRATAAIGAYRQAYNAYVERNNTDAATPKTPLDPSPRILLVPGVGFFASGDNAKAARIAADLYENNIEVIAAAESVGTYQSLGEPDMFDIEYWSLELAKLGSAVEKPLARHVVAITGAAGEIGQASARAFRAAGAEVALLDLDLDAAKKIAGDVGGIAVRCDVTDDRSVAAAFEEIAMAFGGVDILLSNAGAAWQGRIGEVDDAVLRQSFELNFFSHQRVAKAAVGIMMAQKTGGVLLFNASKQAVNPGADFGPYGLPKAATMFLSRQYAVDYGADGIRSNAVNADRIRSGLLTDDMVQARAAARGVSEDAYMTGNLLQREVTGADVAQAFVDLALARKTTGAVITVDGGNIAAALR
ncbi:MAG: bifunctional aldolase/short-chain dehydrogenase [Alphaproteobacteria bacterium]|nr:bifunctional aldolase/short-chain dehydrogenase [Alphaproteobacteria bacterium]